MKKLMIKTGEYQKDGQTKGEYTKLGIIMSGTNGEYVLLDPAVNLAGCLIKQRVMNAGKQNKGKGDMVMCSIFEDQPQQGQQQPNQQFAPAGQDFDDSAPY